MVKLWRAYRPGYAMIHGMAAGSIPLIGHLPDAGGAGDQPAIMMDAFDIMSAAEAELLREQRDR